MCNTTECKLAREKYCLVNFVFTDDKFIRYLSFRNQNQFESLETLFRKCENGDEDAIKRVMVGTYSDVESAVHAYINSA